MPDTQTSSHARARFRRSNNINAEPVRTSLTPDDWIESATVLLVDQGIDAVRVDVLARILGVSAAASTGTSRTATTC